MTFEKVGQVIVHGSRIKRAIAVTVCVVAAAAALAHWKPRSESIRNSVPAAADKSAHNAARAEALIRELDTRAGVTGSEAEDAIIAMGPSVVPVVLDAMGKASDDQQFHLSHAIVKMGAPAVPELLKGLTHADATARISAIVWLDVLRQSGRLGPGGEAGVTPAMAERLADQDRRVRLAASDTLAKFGDAAIKPLVQTLGDARNDASAFAANALASIGAPAAPALVSAMEEKDSLRQYTANAVLIKMGPAAVPALIKGLENKVTFVRVACAAALGTIGDERALPALERAGDDGEYVVQIASNEAIEQIRHRGARPSEAAGSSEDESSQPERASARKMASDTRKLVALMGDKDSDTRRGARNALIKMGAPAVSALLAGLNDRKIEVRIECAGALGRIGDERAVKPLVRLVPRGDRMLRAATIEALGDIGDSIAMPALVKAANDPDELVQKTAIAAILRIDPNYIH